jgi:hypothetical protein
MRGPALQLCKVEDLQTRFDSLQRQSELQANIERRKAEMSPLASA